MQHPRPVVLDALATGEADLVRAALASMIDHLEPPGLWASRAHACAELVAPVLVWARDAKGCELTPQSVGAFLRFDNLVAMAGCGPAGADLEAPLLDWAELPAPLRLTLRAYLCELPGFVPGAATPDRSPARVTYSYTHFVLSRSLQ